MESDEEDFIFYGTPIEREEEINSRKKKSVADASGTMRSLPSWKQEVLRDAPFGIYTPCFVWKCEEIGISRLALSFIFYIVMFMWFLSKRIGESFGNLLHCLSA